MRLTFLGAAGEVTGSCHLLETSRARILIDFGLHQGTAKSTARNYRFPPEIRPESLDAIVLTHAHLDHSGRLPLLAHQDFRGPIWCTPATMDLCRIMLEDSANIQEMDAARLTRSRSGRGHMPVKPLYNVADALTILTRFRALPYDQPTEVAPGITCRFVDAGHILGSASAEITIYEGDRRHTIAFSGDIGVKGTPLLLDPVPIEKADTLVLESTYGDRNHRSLEKTLEELTSLLAHCRSCHGKVLIPAFAVGRTQNLLYFLAGLHREGKLDSAKVVLDSPLAIKATALYQKHAALFDDETGKLLARGESPMRFEGLTYARTSDESRALNDINDHIIIIAGAGMMTGGRILHHLKHAIWRPETTLVIVGFQAEGTLGRQIVDGARRIHIMGDTVAVNARVHTLGGLSAHADQSGLTEWAAALKASRPRVFLNHGENVPRRKLAERLKHELDFDCESPHFGSSFELTPS